LGEGSVAAPLDLAARAAQRDRARALCRVRALFISRVEEQVVESRRRLNVARGLVLQLEKEGGVQLVGTASEPSPHVTRYVGHCMHAPCQRATRTLPAPLPAIALECSCGGGMAWAAALGYRGGVCPLLQPLSVCWRKETQSKRVWHRLVARPRGGDSVPANAISLGACATLCCVRFGGWWGRASLGVSPAVPQHPNTKSEFHAALLLHAPAHPRARAP
jgi:hypothetical protein